MSEHNKSGWWGLRPAEAGPRLLTVADDVAAVLGLYHSRDARFRKLTGAAQEVTRMLGRDFDTWRTLYDRARRALDKLGKDARANTALLKARHSGAQRDAKLPFKRRSTEGFDPLDVWVIDGHTFKAKVRHPDHGAPFAPELTVVLDATTRMIVGWSVGLSSATSRRRSSPRSRSPPRGRAACPGRSQRRHVRAPASSRQRRRG